MKRLKLGASFSHHHLEWLKIDPFPALEEFASLNLKWVRMGCYWSEIEVEKGKYNFEKMESLIKKAEDLGLNIILTVGMKTPRYPEYYLPSWLEKKLRVGILQTIGRQSAIKESLFPFIENTLREFKKYQAIKVWQLENEPLDPTGPRLLKVDSQILSQEVSLAKEKTQNQKTMISLWSSEFSSWRDYLKVVAPVDIVGLDIYFNNPLNLFGFLNRFPGFFDLDRNAQKIISEIKRLGKEVWLAELQAEPWEFNEIWTKKENPKSCLPEQIINNVQKVSRWNLDGILLWGFEYWYWRKINGDNRYWEAAQSAIEIAQELG